MIESNVFLRHYITQYHQLWLKTVSDREDPEPTQMDPTEEQGNQGVTVFPSLGAVITVLSDYMPVTVIVSPGEVMVTPSDDQFSSLDEHWEGPITLADSLFDVYSMDDGEIADVNVGTPGEHHLSVDWRYHARHNPAQGEELWRETVIITVT